MISERPDPKGEWEQPTARVAKAAAGRMRVPSEKKLPQLNCKGLCHDQCTIVPMTPVELRKVERALGGKLIPTADGKCGALDENNRCRVYKDRPLVCKLWGMSEGMICPHGCETDSGFYVEYHEAIGMFAQKAAREGEPVVPMRDEWLEETGTPTTQEKQQ